MLHPVQFVYKHITYKINHVFKLVMMEILQTIKINLVINVIQHVLHVMEHLDLIV